MTFTTMFIVGILTAVFTRRLKLQSKNSLKELIEQLFCLKIVKI
ncbi:hypothetical protein [Campylobacter sp. CFSAN122719]|nr:hypothetical protein OT343_03255 [Campylobacter sp. CFSAN122719]